MILSPIDHELWALVRKRVAQGMVMTGIADELGLSVDELCAWIMAYREPRPARVRNTKANGPAVSPHYSLSKDAQRMANWRRSQAAAIVARSKA